MAAGFQILYKYFLSCGTEALYVMIFWSFHYFHLIASITHDDIKECFYACKSTMSKVFPLWSWKQFVCPLVANVLVAQQTHRCIDDCCIPFRGSLGKKANTVAETLNGTKPSLLLLSPLVVFLPWQVELCAVQPVHSACGSAADGVCPVHTSGSRQAQIPESGLAGRMWWHHMAGCCVPCWRAGTAHVWTARR